MKRILLSTAILILGIQIANAQCAPDVTPPIANCQNLTVFLDGSGNVSVPASAVDNGSSDFCALSTVYFAKPVKLVFTAVNNNEIWSVNVNGTNPSMIYSNASSGSQGPVGIKYEPTTDKFYYGGGNNQEVWVGDIDGLVAPVELANANGLCCEHHDIEIDAANNRYFFTVGNDGVYVGNLDGSGVAIQIFNNSGGGNVTSVAYDPITQKVYACNPNNDEIYMMNDDGTGQVVLYDNADGVSGPRQLELDATTNTLWWTNQGSDELMEGSLDGVVTPFTLWGGQVSIYGIEFEPVTNRLFWVTFNGSDDIHVGAADGTGVQTIVHSGNYGGIRDVAFAGSTTPVTSLNYTCSNVGVNTVQLVALDMSGNTDTCTATITVVDNTAPTASCQNVNVYVDGNGNASTQQDLVYYSSVNSDEIWSVTQAGLNPTLVVSNAGQDCIGMDYEDGVLYYGTGNGQNVNFASALGGGTGMSMPNAGPNTSSYHEVVVDQANNRYFYTVSSDGVYVANLDGSGSETQLATAGSAITGLDYDPIGNKLYYIDQTDEIRSMNADGTGNVLLYSGFDGISGPRQITIDPAGNRLWVSNNGNSEIVMGSLDGLAALTPIYSSQNNVFGIDYDAPSDMLFWTLTGGSLMKSAADGSGTPVAIVTGFSGIRGVNAVSSAGLPLIDNGSVDNCSDLTYTTVPASFTCSDVGSTVAVTMTVIDGSGNMATCVSNVTVLDTIAPVINCLADINTTPNMAGCQAMVTWTAPTFSDNCGVVVFSSSHNSGDVFPVGTTTVTYSGVDPSGNSAACSFDVIVTNDLSATAVETHVLCFGDANGAIDVTPSGGTPPYSYDWDTDGTGDFDDPQDLTGLSVGTYNGVLQDANGCTIGGPVVITEPASAFVLALVTQTDPTCGNTDGAIDVSITGGTPGYTIDWDNDGTGDNDDTEDLTGLGIGTFTIIAFDQNACGDTMTFTLINPGAATLSEIHVDATCFGDTDGSIDLTVAGGTAPFTYDWDNDGTGDNDDTEDLSGLAAGTYNVTVVDVSNCASTLLVTISEPSDIIITDVVIDEVAGNDGSINITVSGGTPPYVFDWDNDGTGDNDDTEDLSGLTAGTYNVVVTDALGCTSTIAVSVLNVAGIDELGAGFTIYPNPTNGLVTIKFEEVPVNTTLNLISVDGKVVESMNVYNSSFNFDLSGLARGMYILEVVNSDGRNQSRIVLQ